MTRVLLLLTTCVAVSPALALDQRKPACPATEVAPGVKMRTGGCPMMFVPVEHAPPTSLRAISGDVPGPWTRAAEPPSVPTAPQHRADGLIHP
ncbi:hypothetical protein [uncultured Alsobacter sp.]|uniref:hypothetical protein n=1 Tax=uncultured Alsobacter sp. TaxID=1748258 RepID=UPI0025E5CBE1|nr:hypothetical protein [uncultured Alsobacter sp.]